jgi:hypothetical protein
VQFCICCFRHPSGPTTLCRGGGGGKGFLLRSFAGTVQEKRCLLRPFVATWEEQGSFLRPFVGLGSMYKVLSWGPLWGCRVKRCRSWGLTQNKGTLVRLNRGH